MKSDSGRLNVLQAIRLKGRVSPEMLAAAAGIATQQSSAMLKELVTEGFVAEANNKFKITASGKTELERQIAAERSTVNQPKLQALYAEFQPLNMDFKRLITDWQLRDGAPNLHQDPSYDAAIFARLEDLDARFAPLLDTMAKSAPRLSHYRARLQHALAKLRGGEVAWFAKPIQDSYHTVWFELHEDLMGLLGLTREAEAVAGRAE